MKEIPSYFLFIIILLSHLAGYILGEMSSETAPFISENYSNTSGQFSQIIRAPSYKGYMIHKYDCSDMSEDLTASLNKNGFSAMYKPVPFNCSFINTKYLNDSQIQPDCEDDGYAHHAIVEVNSTIYIESTTGEVIMPKDYFKYKLGET